MTEETDTIILREEISIRYDLPSRPIQIRHSGEINGETFDEVRHEEDWLWPVRASAKRAFLRAAAEHGIPNAVVKFPEKA